MKNVRPIYHELHDHPIILQMGQYRIYTEPPHQVTFDCQFPSNDWHVHNLYEMCYCTRGNGVFYSGDEKIHFFEGSLFIGTPGLPHRIFMSGEEKMELFYFIFRICCERPVLLQHQMPEEELIYRFIQGSRPVLHHCAELSAFPTIFQTFCSHREGISYHHLISSLILECMSRLSGYPESQTTERKILDYVLSHLQESISVKHLAHLLSMSERGVYSYFQAHYGISPAKYITQIRISEARGYLHMGFSIAQAGEKVGFQDPSTFCRIFRRYTGFTPSEYRKQVVNSPCS